MIFRSLCSGIEAASVAWHPLGWRADAFAEIDKFPSAVLAHHYPHVPNLGDMTKYRDWPDATFDVLVGGTPCFPAGILVTTPSGLEPIESLKAGDVVLTHKKRWRRVLAVGRKRAETIELKGQGHPGLVTTAEHPFYACTKNARSTRRNGKAVRLTCIDGPDWVPASDMAGRHWSSVADFPAMEVPAEDPVGREDAMPEIGEDLMWLAGAYLGDGWTRINDRRGYVIYGVNERKANAIMERVDRIGLGATMTEERTTTRMAIPRRCLARWLVRHFGSGAAAKRIPQWALGMPFELRRALLDGYIAMDGTAAPSVSGWRCSSICWQLILGVKMLANSLGHASTVSRVENKRNACVIEGRTVQERPYWTVSISNSDRTSFELDGLRFACVRSVHETARTEDVFNIEVEDDNSYVADGIVVHNCQSFSVAGLRKGLADPRGNLALVYLGILDRFRPRWMVWENVPGVLSDNGNAFGAFLGGLAELGYGFAYRVLDAQYVRVDGFGRAVPQRRRRVFVVGYLGDWRRPAAVLFERQSLSGNPPPRRKQGQGFAQDVVSSLVSSGRGVERCGETRGQDPVIAVAFGGNNQSGPIDVATAQTAHGGTGRMDFESETFVAHALRAEGFDASEDGTGRGTPLVPVQGVALRGREQGATAELTGEVMTALRCGGGGGDKPHVLAPTICFTAKDHGADAMNDLSPTLRAGGFNKSHANAGVMPAIAFDARQSDVIQYGEATGPLDTDGQTMGIFQSWRVRRLTPKECARLQGFPDDYLDIIYRGKPAADGPKYKALGNSFAVNVVRWIGQRIAIVDAIK